MALARFETADTPVAPTTDERALSLSREANQASSESTKSTEPKKLNADLEKKGILPSVDLFDVSELKKGKGTAATIGAGLAEAGAQATTERGEGSQTDGQAGAHPVRADADHEAQGSEARTPESDARAEGSPAESSELVADENGGFWDGVGRVAGEVWEGVVDEAQENPGGLLLDVAIGAGIAVGATLLSPAALAIAGGAAIVAGGVMLAQNVPDWVDAASVVANPEGHSAERIQAAENELHGVGAGATHLAAGAVGGVGASMARGAITSGIESMMGRAGSGIIDAEYTVVDDALMIGSRTNSQGQLLLPAPASVTVAEGAAVEGGALRATAQGIAQGADDVASTTGQAVADDIAASATIQSGATVESGVARVATESATDDAARLMAAESAEAGVLTRAQSASLYDDLATANGELLFRKPPYNVNIRPGRPGEQVIDINGQPQAVGENMFVIRRVMPDGRVDTYPVDHNNFTTRWRSTGVEGEYTPIPVPTRMVLLDRDIALQGHAGVQTGVVDDMLVTDGQKFWTLQVEPLLDTYVGMNARSQEVLEMLARRYRPGQ